MIVIHNDLLLSGRSLLGQTFLGRFVIQLLERECLLLLAFLLHEPEILEQLLVFDLGGVITLEEATVEELG